MIELSKMTKDQLREAVFELDEELLSVYALWHSTYRPLFGVEENVHLLNPVAGGLFVGIEEAIGRRSTTTTREAHWPGSAVAVTARAALS